MKALIYRQFLLLTDHYLFTDTRISPTDTHTSSPQPWMSCIFIV